MIQNQAELRQTIEQLARMYSILAGQHAEIAPKNYKNYQILAQGPMDYVVRLRREIDEYLGLDEAAILQMQRELEECDAAERASQQAHAADSSDSATVI
jgi:hypothetical protein